jgi:hypothetical protein
MSTPLPMLVKVRTTEPFELAFIEKQMMWGMPEKASSNTR